MPDCFKALILFIRVPPVSIISSIIIASFPLTSPIIFITSHSLALSLLLSIIAISSFKALAINLALPIPPISGETIIEFDISKSFLIFSKNIFLDCIWSTGISKKPCI